MRCDGEEATETELMPLTWLRSRALSRRDARVRDVGHAVLPHPPTDAERDSYWTRRVSWLIVGSAAATATIMAAATRLMLTAHYFLPYFIVMLFITFVAIISLASFAGRTRSSGTRHRALVDAWWAEPRQFFPSIDVWLPICGEPLDIIANSWSAIAALKWPGEMRITVLDDADDERAAELARRHGFDYQVRPNRGWMKKAGNLQFAYQNTDGEFILILDADFCPRSDMLTELVPYFDADPSVGIVQSPQYFETTAEQNWMQRGAGSVQEFFYRAIQPGRDRHRAASCVGTCAVYRRRALDSNGGTTIIGHSEDVHTGFDVGQHGWALRYVPVVLAMGVCPYDVDSFFKQQYRWCMGSMALLGSRKFWRANLSIRARMCYMSGFGYYTGTAMVVLLAPALPVALLVFEPGLIHLRNYVFLAPMYIWAFAVFPRWHRLRYGPEAWTVQLLYSWAHLFAIVDKLRRRPVSWQATGAAERVNRAETMRIALVCWSGALGVVWFGLAGYRAVAAGDLDFLPMLLLGGWFITVVMRVFAATWELTKRVVAFSAVALLLVASAEAAIPHQFSGTGTQLQYQVLADTRQSPQSSPARLGPSVLGALPAGLVLGLPNPIGGVGAGCAVRYVTVSTLSCARGLGAGSH
jgi:cellulose synthase/poly-beta-1,6-N-acetylglucosamine synthase-like glycosyltransferase